MGCGVGALGKDKYQVLHASANTPSQNSTSGLKWATPVEHAHVCAKQETDMLAWPARASKLDEEEAQECQVEKPFCVEALPRSFSGESKLRSQKGPPLKFGNSLSVRSLSVSEIEETLPKYYVDKPFHADNSSQRVGRTRSLGASLKLAPLVSPPNQLGKAGPALKIGNTLLEHRVEVPFHSAPRHQRHSDCYGSSFKPPPHSPDKLCIAVPAQSIEEVAFESQVQPSVLILDGRAESQGRRKDCRKKKGSLGVDLKQRLAKRESVRQSFGTENQVYAGSSKMHRSISSPSIEEVFPMMMQKVSSDAIDADPHWLTATKKQELYDQLSSTEHLGIETRRQIFRTLSFQCHASRHSSKLLADTLMKYLIDNREWYLEPCSPTSPARLTSPTSLEEEINISRRNCISRRRNGISQRNSSFS